MEASILTSVKKTLGLDSSYTAFDEDVIIFINTAFSTLHQLGVGPPQGFTIIDAEAKWEDFLADDKVQLDSAKTYIYLRVRLLFDPPQTQYVLGALQTQIEQLEWRMNTHREGAAWTDPMPPVAEEV